MEHFIYPAVLLIFAVVCWRLLVSERKARTLLREERDAIEGEEKRMFDFLHGLGAALQEDISPISLHRYVVNGVATVVGADGGIIYLRDEKSGRLVPIFQSTGAVPVVPVPDEILEIEDQEEAMRNYRAYMRLSPLDVEGTFVGRVFESKKVVLAPVLDQHEYFDGKENYLQKDLCVIGAPLHYGGKSLGVLIMVRRAGKQFSANDSDVFTSVAEQCAFALGNAIVHAEVHEKRRLESELQQASEIQRILLPRKAPELSDYNVAASYQAARIVSGDYYDYLRVDQDRFGVAIGDVCGKGIAASLIVAMCRSVLRASAGENLSPASVLHEVNRSIFPDIKEDMFVSFLYLILERDSNELTLARAGHEHPLVFRKKTGEVEMIELPGMAAGVDPDNVFRRSVKDHRITMDSGDILLIYTDGIIEAINREGDEFGLERLRESISALSEHSAESVVEKLTGEVEQFCDGFARTDDITLIAVEKR